MIRPNPFPGNVFLEAVRNLLRNKNNFQFLAALGGSESELSILDITGSQFQDLADPHSTPSHQLKKEPIPGFDGAKNDFIHHLFLQNGPTDGSRWSIQFFQHGGIAWAAEIGIEVLVNELKKEVSWEYRVHLVNCLVPWLKSVRKERTSSGVREFRSLSPN